MLRLLVRDFGQDEWTDLVSQFSNLSLLQTWEYGQAKAQTGPWKVSRAIFLKEERTVGAVQALVRTVPGLNRGLVWINRGPLWDMGDHCNSSLLFGMIERLHRHWVEERRMYLRVAPPAREGQIDAARLEEIGYRLDRELPGWASARVDLLQPLEALRGQLQQKWRNCLNKAERLGLGLESGSGESAFSAFLEGYRLMLRERAYPTSVTPEMLSRLQAWLPEKRRLWVLMAKRGQESLGGVLVAKYGQVTEYLAGSVNDEGRRANAGQLLLWRALCEMKDQGFRWFDLGGMDPERTPSGIFHFKAGLGGTAHRLMGEIDAHDGSWINRIVCSRVRRSRHLVGV